MPSRSPKKKQAYMKQADVLFAKYVKARDGGCVGFGEAGVRCGGYLQTAHLISRSYKSIRTDERNAVALCAAHHTFWTHRPLEWEAFIEERWPGLWAELRAKALTYAKVDWRAEVERLSGLVR